MISGPSGDASQSAGKVILVEGQGHGSFVGAGTGPSGLTIEQAEFAKDIAGAVDIVGDPMPRFAEDKSADLARLDNIQRPAAAALR